MLTLATAVLVLLMYRKCDSSGSRGNAERAVWPLGVKEYCSGQAGPRASRVPVQERMNVKGRKLRTVLPSWRLCVFALKRIIVFA